MFTFRDLLETYLEPQVAARLAMAVPKPQGPTKYEKGNNMPKPEPKLWEGQVNVDPKPVPSPLFARDCVAGT